MSLLGVTPPKAARNFHTFELVSEKFGINTVTVTQTITKKFEKTTAISPL